MSWGIAGVLLVLALSDSPSFGTLLIPVWLMLAPGRVRAGRILVFLGTVTLLYFVIGVLLLAGIDLFREPLGALVDATATTIAQLLVGVALFVLSFPLERRSGDSPHRLQMWRDRVVGTDSNVTSLLAVALVAVGLEVATMLPYLAAIGIITAANESISTSLLVLAGYCMVMIAPAVTLLVARVVAHDAIEPALLKIDRWLRKNAATTTAWIVGIIGVLLALDAISRLGGAG